MHIRVFMAGEADEANFALLLRFEQRLCGATGTNEQFRIVLKDDADLMVTRSGPKGFETVRTYTVADSDVGRTIVIQESATNAGGRAAPVRSAPTAVVTAATPNAAMAA